MLLLQFYTSTPLGGFVCVPVCMHACVCVHVPERIQVCRCVLCPTGEFRLLTSELYKAAVMVCHLG